MKFTWKSWLQKNKKIIALSPMDGWTDSGFRQMIKKISPLTLVFTEFVSVDGLTHKECSQRLLQKAIYHDKKEKPLIVQLFGNNPEKFALAASFLEKQGIGAIDLNFGCPARKVIHSNHGAALLKNEKLALEIVKAVKKATKLNVSVKTRLGFFDKNQILNLAEKLFQEKVDALIVHGRTAKEKFSRHSDLKNIFELKKRFPQNIIMANGDIKDPLKAVEILEKTDGVMIGRQAMQNPWIFAEIFSALKKEQFPFVTWKQKIELILFHAQKKQEIKGKRGIIEMRKFLVNFCKEFKNARYYRQKLIQTETLQEIKEIFRKLNFN